MFCMYVLSPTPPRGGPRRARHPSPRTGEGVAQPGTGPTCCDLGPSLHLSELGFRTPRQEADEPPPPPSASPRCRSPTGCDWPKVTPAPGYTAQARERTRRSVPAHPLPCAPPVLGWGPARGGPGAPRTADAGPTMRRGPGAGGGASAGVLLLCEGRRLGFAKVHSASSSSSRRLFLL